MCVVPGCVYDPDTPLNILGVPALGLFFGDSADDSGMLAADGTTIKSGASKSHFIWDHGKHERHFLHGLSQMPELFLYVGNGYFNAFCTHVDKMLSDKVYYAFSYAYSISQLLQPRNLQVHISYIMKMENWKNLDHTHGTNLKLIPPTHHYVPILNQSHRCPGQP